MMTPEDRLFAAVIDNAIKASLLEPIGELPDYNCEAGTDEWIRTRDERRRLREKEKDRLEGKDCLKSEYIQLLYKIVYHCDIERLLRILDSIWNNIEIAPSMALQYRRVFDAKS